MVSWDRHPRPGAALAPVRAECAFATPEARKALNASTAAATLGASGN